MNRLKVMGGMTRIMRKKEYIGSCIPSDAKNEPVKRHRPIRKRVRKKEGSMRERKEVGIWDWGNEKILCRSF